MNTAHTETIVLLVDMKTKRPGCVLLQAACGGDTYKLQQFFDARHWVLAPTKDMQLIRGTPEQWKKLALMLEKRR